MEDSRLGGGKSECMSSAMEAAFPPSQRVQSLTWSMLCLLACFGHSGCLVSGASLHDNATLHLSLLPTTDDKRAVDRNHSSLTHQTPRRHDARGHHGPARQFELRHQHRLQPVALGLAAGQRKDGLQHKDQQQPRERGGHHDDGWSRVGGGCPAELAGSVEAASTPLTRTTG
jgi:hypothetical protein